MKITMPKGFKEWGIYAAVGSFIFSQSIKLFKFLFNSRGSSTETKKEFESMKEDNVERHEEIKKSIKELKESFEQSFKKLVSKEILDLKLESLKKEIESNNKIRFAKLQAVADKAIENAKKQEIEARGMKQALREVFTPMIKEYHKMNENKTKKSIRKKTKRILEENNDEMD